MDTSEDKGLNGSRKSELRTQNKYYYEALKFCDEENKKIILSIIRKNLTKIYGKR